jgi:phenylpropionate dioxygenase-like ring-hydroxylating dioxygenase large terminal subunit
MFLRNFWYVAAYDHEVGRKPLGRTVLGEPVVLFRKEDGTPVPPKPALRRRGFSNRSGAR